MTFAVAQMRIAPGCPQQNTETMLQLIASAKEQGAELIFFPELAISGLLVGDLLHSQAFVEECLDCGLRVAAAAEDIMVIYGNLHQTEKGLQNCVYLAKDGEAGRLSVPVGKSWVFGAYTPFLAANEFQVYNLPLDNKVFRIGFLLGDWRQLPLPYAANDIDLLVDLSNKPLFLQQNSPLPRVEGRQMLSVNSTGLQNSGKANYLFYGGSCYYDFDGGLIARGEMMTSGLYFWQRSSGVAYPAWEEDMLLGEGLVAGVKEFMQMIHSDKVVIGISGGIDSALAACIYTRALGPENVYLLSMPSRYNSEETKSLAQRMATGLGTNFATIPIQDQLSSLENAFKIHSFADAQGMRIPLQHSSSVLENMQARERGRLLATAAASLGGVFTCNGNKAELAVGYATFYGDLAGAFAAQGDLWKFQVYEAATYYQQQFPEAPLAEIAAIRPSAELSEAQDITKGLGDPLIYDYHDYLLRYWVERDADLSDTLRHYQQGNLEEVIGCKEGLTAKLFAYAEDFLADIERWWRMYRGIGVAKRIQSPPLLALSQRPFGEPHPQAQGEAYFSQDYSRKKQFYLGSASATEKE